MMIFVCVIFALLSSFGISEEILYNSENDIVDVDVKCRTTETNCGEGCCPYADAICCEETHTCCRSGSVCLKQLDLCIGVQPGDKGNSTPALYTERSTKLRDVSVCPPYTTPCYDRCCPYVQGVCCIDRVHCCPNGYYCTGTYCMRGSVAAAFLNVSLSPPKMMKLAMKKPIQKKYPVTSKAGGPCCLTLYGFKCCPDFWICTQTGCIPNNPDPY